MSPPGDTAAALGPSPARGGPFFLSGHVRVWWARADGALAHPWLMDGKERERYRAMRRARSRELFALGCALIRLAAGDRLGIDPRAVRVTRRCPGCGGPHGKPYVAGLEISLSHTGTHVVCAVTSGAPVGVDVEDGGAMGDPDPLAGRVLAPAEAALYHRLPATGRRAALLAYWTRKEAVLKATGDGLRVPMRALTVSGPSDPPRLLAWTGYDPPPRISLRALRGPRGREPGGTVAVLAVLGAPPYRLTEIDAEPALIALGHPPSNPLGSTPS